MWILLALALAFGRGVLWDQLWSKTLAPLLSEGGAGGFLLQCFELRGLQVPSWKRFRKEPQHVEGDGAHFTGQWGRAFSVVAP